eukprot:Em0006g417a
MNPHENLFLVMEKLELMVLLLIYDITGSSTQSLPYHTASGDTCTSSICPNTVVTYTCTITSGTTAGYTDWILSTGTCPTNTFPDKIRLSQLVSGSCTAVVISTCGPYRASSIQSTDPAYCLSSILTVNITAAMNGSTVMCYNTNLITPSITTIVSMTTINVVGPPGHPNAVANTIGPDMVLVVVNPSSSGGLPTSYSVTISNSSYVYSNSTTAFLNGSAMVTFIGLTIGTNYTISAVAINCAGSSNSSNTTTIYVSWPAPTPSPPTSSASIISPTSAATAAICVHSIDVSTAVSITVSITFIMAFPLGVLVTICISCISKTRSKTTSPHPSTPNVPYEVVGINQKKIDVIPLENNDAYGTVK